MKNISLITSSSLTNIISNSLWLNRNHEDKGIKIILNFEKNENLESTIIQNLYLKQTPRNLYLFDLSCLWTKLIFFCPIYLLMLINNIDKKYINIQLFNLIIIQPRFRWLSERFGVLGKLLPKFDTILVGDGLSSECLADSPNWTKLKGVSFSRIDKENLLKSFYLYTIYKNKNLKENYESHRFSQTELKKTLEKINNILKLEKNYKSIYQHINRLKENQKRIFIFTTTTFSEYDRCSMNSEIKLYTIFLENFLLKYNYNIDNDYLIYKFHPSTNYLKIKRLKDKVNKIIKLKVSTNNISNKKLNRFPLELLLYNLSNDNHIYINGISTAILASSYIFKNLSIEMGFGKDLIYKYFENEYHAKKRIEQEELISRLLVDKPDK